MGHKPFGIFTELKEDVLVMIEVTIDYILFLY